MNEMNEWERDRLRATGDRRQQPLNPRCYVAVRTLAVAGESLFRLLSEDMGASQSAYRTKEERLPEVSLV